jgi:hypothetical protein
MASNRLASSLILRASALIASYGIADRKGDCGSGIVAGSDGIAASRGRGALGRIERGLRIERPGYPFVDPDRLRFLGWIKPILINPGCAADMVPRQIGSPFSPEEPAPLFTVGFSLEQVSGSMK